MKLSTVIVLLVVVAAGSYGLTKMANKDGSGSNKEKSGEVTAGKGGPADPIVGDVDRVRVPPEGPVAGPGEREGHHRRVLRLPVPVLQPRRADARPDR